MTDELNIVPASTALVVVDIQNFTLGLDLHPHDGATVLDNNIRLAEACRAAGILVVLVRVGHDDAGVPSPDVRVDASFSGFTFPDGAKEIPPALGPRAGDVVVDKYNWGAFHGTSLDTHLRRRGIDTLIVTGLVTNIGVDTTMRHANERGYHQLLASDAVSAMSAAEHDYVLATIAPRLARVRTTDQILAALAVAQG